MARRAFGLVAKQANHARVGADEPDVARLAHFGEIRALGQEAVAGMQRIGAGDFGGADDRRNVQITVAAARRADADVFIRKPDVQRVLVGLRIHGHGLDAQLAAREDHPQRDLSTIGDKNFLEHGYWLEGLIANRRSPYCTAWPFST